MENGCLARMNLIGTRGRPGTVPGVPLKGLMLCISEFILNKGLLFTINNKREKCIEKCITTSMAKSPVA
jgi:hypothetical protein